MKIAALSAVALLASTGAAFAFGEREIARVQYQQQQRIENGRYTGEITRREYQRLVEEQEAISRAVWQAKGDGHVSCREYIAIRAAQDEASQHIQRQKHDAQLGYRSDWREGRAARVAQWRNWRLDRNRY